MRRLTASATAIVLLASAAAAVAQPPSSTKVLQDGLQAIVASTSSQAEALAQAQGIDHDQGDDHASDIAIMKVCNHDNPSAQRSAICPHPNSPP